MIQPAEPRLIGIGTPEKLWVPSRADLAREHWNNAYLYWADLNGLKLPPMIDADIYYGEALGATFQDPVSYTQARWLQTDITTTVPAGISSYNHLIEPIFLQAPNADHPAVRLVHEHVFADYTHSWRDSIYRLVHELGMSMQDVWDVFEVAFKGYPLMLSRLKWHLDSEQYSKEPPVVITDLSCVGVKMRREIVELDLRNGLSSYDRWAAARMLEQRVDDPRIRFWFAQLYPNPVLKHVDYGVSPNHSIDLKKMWPE